MTVVDRLVKIGPEHNHQSAPYLNHVDAFRSKLLGRARNETTPIPRIYADELANLRRHGDEVPGEYLCHFPTFDSMRSPMYRERQKNIPRLRKTRSTVALEETWTRTDAGEQFLIADHGKILIFATREKLEHLCNADIMYADGTFFSSPCLFLQTYPIHAEVQGIMHPLVYFLLPNKSHETYTTAFRLLKTETERLHLNLQPQILQIDFEKAVANAALAVFDNIQIRGCYFHFSQALWRRIQHLGLVSRYKNDADFPKLSERAKALPLAPIHQVDNVWLDVDATADAPQVMMPPSSSWTMSQHGWRSSTGQHKFGTNLPMMDTGLIAT
ncbi:uncharacterized protein LOC124138621 [Haliotis rufescens]|uniref:uncharacterized protein LOC124138621 n=1 Tax=Haliotis rufescens TaxID=6454 RepID=UPI001EAFD26A|nr:uncharacterized protein LOC124138621 [Haliotis rufescens]